MGQTLPPDTPIDTSKVLNTPGEVADLAASMATDAMHPGHQAPPVVQPMAPPAPPSDVHALPTLPAVPMMPVTESEQERDAESPLARYIGQFITLRDRIEEVNNLNKEKMKPLYEAREKLEAFLMDQLVQSGSDSLKVRGVGTIYKNTDDSATVGDQAEFKRHVIGTGNFDLIDFRANKTGVREYLMAHGGEPPPGVNFSSRVKLGVRRDTTSKE
jgi:hypothetical protein